MKTGAAMNAAIPVTGRWFIRAPRCIVYAIISDFEAMPRNFPAVAREMKIVKRDGPHLTVEALSASFGRFFPSARILIAAELLPEEGGIAVERRTSPFIRPARKNCAWSMRTAGRESNTPISSRFAGG